VVHARPIVFYRLENLRLEFITAGHFVHTIASFQTSTYGP
jgi:hypothetical protein